MTAQIVRSLRRCWMQACRAKILCWAFIRRACGNIRILLRLDFEAFEGDCVNEEIPNLEIICERIRRGDYFIKSHAATHAFKEGFDRQHLLEAVLNGKIIETYPNDQRVLVCGQAALTEHTRIYLHVVCEYADPIYVEFVTAYIPDDAQWQIPPFRRQRKTKK